jgi:hypothetical protein
VTLAVVAVLALLPATALAQEGQIAGTVRDASGGVMPGVLVEVTSPALIEKVRSATTDSNGQYRLTNLPVGTYSATFTLSGFTRAQQNNILLTTGFTAPVNAVMAVGALTDTVVVSAESPTVDVQNARQAIVFAGDEIKDLPTNRNVNSLLALTPGISSGYQPGTLAGVCSGGVGVFCNPGVTGFNVGDTDNTNLSQGRVMVDGVVVNSGAALPIVGGTGGYTADIANAQEITVQISGALGESETGGASINIIPRTGGNSFAGSYNTTYTTADWFAANNGEFPGLPAVFQAVKSDHDISGSFGGPIKRDALWFYAIGRTQGIHKLPVGQGEGDDPQGFWPNLHEGKWGFNYQPDRARPRVEYKNIWRNVNARVTWQASQKNKFGFFWDEQDFCQDPCLGVVSVFTSPESWWSVQTPNRLQQVTWTNPFTSKLLFEANLTMANQRYDTASHREYENPRSIPRIVEIGDTTGGDALAPRVNNFSGAGFFAQTSGSLNSAINQGGAEKRNAQSYRTRASASYVTGSHNAKFGYEGGYFTQEQTNLVNDPRMTYNYNWPAANCAATNACGNTSLQFPENPNNIPGGPGGGRRPIPNTVQFNTGVGTLIDRVNYSAFYVQDQWTVQRLTLNGALRYDHATSGYGETCIGPDKFVPVQSNGQNFYCTPETDGVNFQNITPRWGAAWDVFGTGRTSLKWNMGKYLTQAQINTQNIYGDANPARRTVNTLQRAWNDIDGDRIVDCDLMALAPNGECGAFSFGQNDTTRFGRDPLGLDAAGLPVGLQTTQCGRREAGIPAAVQAYCDVYGESLLEGWNRRQAEWQLGFGVQHEILPRLSGEVTYNRRMYSNRTASDQLGIGCDRFNGRLPLEECQALTRQYRSDNYDFYSIVAPSDPRLPNGGGYRVLGLAAPKPTNPGGLPTAQTQWELRNYAWNGVDTNFVWRGPGGLRVNGGTSTGRTQRDECDEDLDAPDVKGRDGAEFLDGCLIRAPWQTRVNGTAAYTIPWVDVLVSTVFQSFAGVERSATVTVNKGTLIWMPGSEGRALVPCATATNGTGCVGNTNNDVNTTINLLNNNEMFGERISLFDVKIAKNIRIRNTRTTIGADIYNVFNSDAIQDYDDNFIDNPTTPAVEVWGDPTSLVSPRFVRLSVQFNF